MQIRGTSVIHAFLIYFVPILTYYKKVSIRLVQSTKGLSAYPIAG